MDYNTIEFNISSSVASLTLNRPESLNSFNTEMHEEVRAALKEVKKNSSIRSLLLTGNGRGFCAGQDLNDRSVDPGGQRPDLGDSLEKRYNPLINTLFTLPIPVICAVNGIAAGAGANIALACDIVLASRTSYFLQAFCKLGLIPDSGGTWQLPHLVGRSRAMGMALLGDKISAEQAEQWGLIWQCIDDNKLQSESLKIAEHLAQQPTKGLAYIKRAINTSFTNSLADQLKLEKDLQGLAGQSDDYLEGVLAFKEKRIAKFIGK